ncbi:hypothetical protein ACUOFC_66330 [Escherichia sp. TWPC-MK]
MMTTLLPVFTKPSWP